MKKLKRKIILFILIPSTEVNLVKLTYRSAPEQEFSSLFDLKMVIYG